MALAPSPPVAAAVAPDANCDPPPDGEWVIASVDAVCSDRTIQVRNLTVIPPRTLTLRGVTLVVNATYNGSPEHGVNVYGDADPSGRGRGRLVVEASTVRPLDPSLRPKLRVDPAADLSFQSSTLEDFSALEVGANGGTVRGQIVLAGSRFHRLAAGVVVAGGIEALIRDNLFQGGAGPALTLDSYATVRNNTILDHGAGLLVHAASPVPRIEENTITRCGVALEADNGEAPLVVQLNDIFRNGDTSGIEAAFAGNGRFNWWGSPTPDPSRFRGGFSHAPSASTPFHPERLPTAALNASALTGFRGMALVFDAAQSRPSTLFGAALVQHAWDFGDGAKMQGLRVEHVYASMGIFRVVLTTADALGIARSTAKEVEIVNRLPTLDRVVPEPPQVQPGRDLDIHASARDPDGDPVQFLYFWSHGGVAQPDLKGPRLPGDRIRERDVWSVRIVPTDGYAEGASLTLNLTAGATAKPGSPLILEGDLDVSVRRDVSRAILVKNTQLASVPVLLRVLGKPAGLAVDMDPDEFELQPYEAYSVSLNVLSLGTVPGDYVVSVIDARAPCSSAAPDCGRIGNLTIHVLPANPPLVRIVDPPSQIRLGNAIQFVPELLANTTAISAWRWDFGDGETSTEEMPIHLYVQPGLYPVLVTATDREGTTSEPAWALVDVVNQAPHLQADWRLVPKREGETRAAHVEFSAAGSFDLDGGIETITWSFGDGGAATGSVVNHWYEKAGDYRVSLGIEDGFGAANVTLLSITIPAESGPAGAPTLASIAAWELAVVAATAVTLRRRRA